jgi:DNA-binding MarR family transcriptional regulator
MERKGWIRRTRDASDRRARRVRITPSGQAMRRRVFAVARRFHRRALAPFSDARRRRLLEDLYELYRSLEPPGRNA